MAWAVRSIIVWIAPVFNDEHRDAVQWMNENSREGIYLFAIRLEVWRIADSPPAVRLNPVEKPSEWKEKAQRQEGELSETKQLSPSSPTGQAETEPSSVQLELWSEEDMSGMGTTGGRY